MHGSSCAIPRSVFRAYDIRGVVPDELNEQAFYTLGRALSVRLFDLNRFEAVVARDGRLTSEALSKALIRGLLDSGIHVFDLGAVPSPVMYFAVNTLPYDCGFMVTGSHNPADYNGLKMVLAGKTLVQEDIDVLYDIVTEGRTREGKGVLTAQPILPAYRERILSDIRLARPFKMVVDCGNGIAGVTAPEILSALGCEVIPLYCDIDGRFPNHHPDPTIEANLADLKKAVIAHGADLGLAFDGDADRLGVITNTEEMIWPDRLMMFYAKAILKRCPQSTIVFDVKCSNHLARVISNAGGIPRMCPTGHSIVKGIMKKEKAVLAGEMSGHLFFQDRWYGFDDALYSACRLLETLSECAATVSEQFKAIPDSINTPEIKIPVADEQKFALMQRFCEEARFPDATIVRIDGMRVEFANGWGLIRASNTTPCLVARFEADDVHGLEWIKAQFRQELVRLAPQLAVAF